MSIKQQKVYPEDRRAFSWFGSKAMFIASLGDYEDHIMFEWRGATGEKKYDGERILTKMSKAEIALLIQALEAYAMSEKMFFSVCQRFAGAGNNEGKISFYHENKNGHTVIELVYYQGKLLLRALKKDNQTGKNISLSIRVDTALYDFKLTFEAFHFHICQNYIYGKALKYKQQYNQVQNQQKFKMKQSNYQQHALELKPEELDLDIYGQGDY